MYIRSCYTHFNGFVASNICPSDDSKTQGNNTANSGGNATKSNINLDNNSSSFMPNICLMFKFDNHFSIFY